MHSHYHHLDVNPQCWLPNWGEAAAEQKEYISLSGSSLLLQGLDKRKPPKWRGRDERKKKGPCREQIKQIWQLPAKRGQKQFCFQMGTGPSETCRINPYQSCTLTSSAIHSCLYLDNTLKPEERTNLGTALHWADESALQCAFSLGRKGRIGRGQHCRRQQYKETAAEFDAEAAHHVGNILVQCSWPKSSSLAEHILQHERNKHIPLGNSQAFQLQNAGTAKPKALGTAHASNSKTENVL